MAAQSTKSPASIAPWQRNLLIITAVLTVLLIAMGGVLCVTQSIRDCPDWPGCFGKVIPPAETGPILEYTHRVLAALSGLFILSAAISGLIRTPRLRWISIPPLIAVLLLIEVSYFGARVVLQGLSPGWAAVDVGSALLVVALMVTTASIAIQRMKGPGMADRLVFNRPIARLTIATTMVVYVILVSGILVAGKDSVTACLGWPIYSSQLFQQDVHLVGKILRLILSVVGIGMIVAILVWGWRNKQGEQKIYYYVRWVGVAFLLEMLVQVLILLFGHLTSLLVIYTVTAAGFWALLVALTVRTGLGAPVSQTKA